MKTIFITGTSSGLGKAAVQLFHSKGWKVIATMRDTGKAKDFDQLENVTVLQLDITRPDEIDNAVRTSLALGEVDVVLNNAAYGAIGPLESVDDEHLLKQVNTNLLGAIRVTRAFIPHFREKRSGIFINITSIASLVTFPFSSLYHAVKFGLHGWSEGLSYELAAFNIRVKSVAPGFIHSDFASNAAITTAEAYQQQMDHNFKVISSMMDPATTGSTPQEVAAVVYEAVTDGTNQVHYIAGNDAKNMSERRLEIGAEASVQEIAKLFLG